MIPREELIEAMAIEDQKRRPFALGWHGLSPETKTRIMQEMELHLKAIEAHAGGCVVVPSKPTKEMAYELLCNEEWESTAALSPYAPTPEAEEPK